MRGNFSTEGRYERTRAERPLSQSTLDLRLQPSLTRLIHDAEDTRALVTPEAPAKPLQSTVHAYPRPKQAKTTVNRSSNRVKKSRTYNSSSQTSPAGSGRKASWLNAPTTETSRNKSTTKSMWTGSRNIMIDAEVVATHYDSSYESSLISSSAVVRLGLQTLPCPPSFRSRIMTNYHAAEFVKVNVRAPWLEDGELGECNIAIVNGSILESEGIELLAGKPILEKLRVNGSFSEETQAQINVAFDRGVHRLKTMSSMAKGLDYWAEVDLKNSHACPKRLHSDGKARSLSSSTSASTAPSYGAPNSTDLTSFPTTQSSSNENTKSSLSRVHNEDNTRFEGIGAGDQGDNPSLTNVFGQTPFQNSGRLETPQLTAASPNVSHNELGFLNSSGILPGSIWDTQTDPPGYPFLFHIPETFYGSGVASSLTNNAISTADFPETQQDTPTSQYSFTEPDWSLIFSPLLPETRIDRLGSNDSDQGRIPFEFPWEADDATFQFEPSCVVTSREQSTSSTISQASEESRRFGLEKDWSASDTNQIDDGSSGKQASYSSKGKMLAWTESRSTDNAKEKGLEAAKRSKFPSSDDWLNQVNEGVTDLSLGQLDRLRKLAGHHEQLLCLISEIKHSIPDSMTLNTDPKIFMSEHLKLGLEDLTHHKWEWWPFSEPSRPLTGNEVRLEWTCSCGRKRTDNVPYEFGQAMVEFVRQGCPSTGTSGTQATIVTSSDRSSNVSCSSVLSYSTSASTLETVDVQSRSHNIGSGHPPDIDAREKHIFLVASCGSLQLHQIISTAQCTMAFSENLRRGYRQLRGFWRYWFSIYKFSHCDFFEFEKFCSSTFSDVGPGLPPEEHPYTEDYFYKPRPARSKTPISSKEFEHIYYHYRKTSAAKINAWYQPFTVMGQAPFYWPRFFKQLPPLFQKQIDGNLPTDTVPKIPQRLSHFDELSNNRETFWGLHAREQISAMMVLLYALLAFMPSLAFCFVYWFGLGDKQPDMQNATTPLTISLTTFGLFMAYLVKH